MAITEYVFKGSDNPVDVTIKSSKTPTPLAGVTRVTVTLVESRLTYDSAVIAADITWTDTMITLNLNDKPVTGSQRAIIKVFDPSHPDGQVVAHPDGPSQSRLTLQFVA